MLTRQKYLTGTIEGYVRWRYISLLVATLFSTEKSECKYAGRIGIRRCIALVYATDNDVIVNLDAFRFDYADFVMAKIQLSLPAMPALTARIDSFLNGAALPMALLFGFYALLRDDTLAQNLSRLATERCLTWHGAHTALTLLVHLLAATAILTRFNDTVRITFNPALYCTSTSASATAFWCTFKDDMG